MQADSARSANAFVRPGLFRAVLASLLATLLASCSASTSPNLELDSPGFAATGSAAMSAVNTDGTDIAAEASATGEEVPSDEGALPVETAAPAAKPDAAADQTTANAIAATVAEDAAPSGTDTTAGVEPAVVATASAAPAQAAPEAAADPTLVDKKKQTFLSAFFGGPKAGAATPKPLIAQPAAKPAVASEEPAAKPKPIIQLASAEGGELPTARAAMAPGSENALPGVRQTMLFEIKRKSGLDDDSDVDLHEDEMDGGSVQLASAAGLARLAPNGLLKQTESVDTACLKPALVRILKTAEGHFGKRFVITSGYRSPAHNRRVRGAKKSQHMFCAAADIQMPGVSKWELARYFRSVPGRGGVGTYCHTESIHVDIGPERDWNWRCRRRG